MAKRRLSPYATAAVAGAVLLTGAAAWWALGDTSKAKRKTSSRKKNPQPAQEPKLRCDPSPYTFDLDLVVDLIDTHIAEGEFDKAFIAQDIAFRLFGEHPEAGYVAFPPQPQAPRGVDCVWGLVTVLVDRQVPDLRSNPVDPAVDDLLWTVHLPDDPGYPWEEPAVHPENVPTPGLFVDTGHGNVEDIDDLVVQAFETALWMAGLDPALASANNSTAKRLRRELRNLLSSCGFNDLLYGQLDPDKAGGSAERNLVYMMNAEGRGLNWQPVHADNMSRIGSAMPPCRTTNDWGEPFASEGEGMLLWIPALDLDALSARVPSIEVLDWSDGTPTAEPPPCVQALGLNLRKEAA